MEAPPPSPPFQPPPPLPTQSGQLRAKQNQTGKQEETLDSGRFVNGKLLFPGAPASPPVRYR